MNISELKTIWRKLKRDKIITGINLFGLTIGIAAVVTISAFVVSEMGRGKEIPNAQNIYRLEMETSFGHVSVTPDPLGNFLREKFPEIIACVNMQPGNFMGRKVLNTLETEDDSFVLKNILYADSAYANVFSHKIISGDIANTLKKQNGIVLTQSESKRLFGNADAIGKTVKLNNEYILEVGAVIEDIPKNAINYFQSIVNLSVVLPNDNDKWNNFRVFTYFRLAPGVNLSQLEENTAKVLNEQCSGITGIDFSGNVSLVPYSKLYFYKPSIIDHLKHGSYQTAIIFISISILILLIAVINFINLSFAQSIKKAKEIGIRQISGSPRQKVFMLFVAESLVLTFISFMLAFLLLKATSFFLVQNDITGIFSTLFSPVFIGIAIAGAIGIGIIAGFFPGIRMLRLNAVQILKGNKLSANNEGWTKLALTSFQFIIAIGLIVSIITVNKQLRYIENKNLGFEKENLIYFQLDNDKGDLIFDKLSHYPEIKSFCLSDGIPGSTLSRSNGDLMLNGEKKQVKYMRLHSDHHYISTMGMNIIQGRDFSESDKNVAIINESAAKSFGIETLENQPKIEGYSIIGIVRDFQIESLHQQTEPLVIAHAPWTKYCIVRVSSESQATLRSATNNIKTAWNEIFDDTPVEIHFLSKTMEMMYHKDLMFKITLNVLVFLALFISCIGLFGVSLFLINNRIKEIGIRKVNGAKVSEVMAMLNKDFIKWVAIAFVIATPIAYYAMNKWLENFAYKTELSWWIFTLSGILALGIALLTVSWQSWKAATRNPVEALRYE